MIDIDFDSIHEGGCDEDFLEIPGNFIVDGAIEEDEEEDVYDMDPYDDPVIDDDDDLLDMDDDDLLDMDDDEDY